MILFVRRGRGITGRGRESACQASEKKQNDRRSSDVRSQTVGKWKGGRKTCPSIGIVWNTGAGRKRSERSSWWSSGGHRLGAVIPIAGMWMSARTAASTNVGSIDCEERINSLRKVGVWTVDVRGRVITWSDGRRRSWGYPLSLGGGWSFAWKWLKYFRWRRAATWFCFMRVQVRKYQVHHTRRCRTYKYHIHTYDARIFYWSLRRGTLAPANTSKT